MRSDFSTVDSLSSEIYWACDGDTNEFTIRLRAMLAEHGWTIEEFDAAMSADLQAYCEEMGCRVATMAPSDEIIYMDDTEPESE